MTYNIILNIPLYTALQRTRVTESAKKVSEGASRFTEHELPLPNIC